MPAFIVSIPREVAADPGVMRPYQEQIEATLAPYGGRYRALRRHRLEVLEGDWRPPHGVVVLEFPSFEQAKAWYHSPEYAPLLAIRHAHNRFDMILVDGLAEGETLLSYLRQREAHEQRSDSSDTP